jgi:glycosyltransferase involved in cell wall biosynthesis
VDDVADVLRGGDLFLRPSETESFGLAALEAMACGVPVIASRVGGIPEVVTDGESGYLAAVGDVPTMTERAIEVLRDPARLEEMRHRAVARAADFSADRVVPQYERLYEDVLRD